MRRRSAGSPAYRKTRRPNRGRPSIEELRQAGQLSFGELNRSFDAAIDAQIAAQEALRMSRRLSQIQRQDQMMLRLFTYVTAQMKIANNAIRSTTAKLTEWEKKQKAA